MESRVRIKEDFTADTTRKFTGTVIGISSTGIFFTYIVLLDEPYDDPEHGTLRAVAVPGQGLCEDTEHCTQFWEEMY